MTNEDAIKTLQELVKLNQQFAEEIENLKRPHGKWITRTEDNGVNYRFYCSCCDREVKQITDYCPNCGADMRGDGADCMDEDAKQASIPYTYNAPEHDWKCGYPDITRGKKMTTKEAIKYLIPPTATSTHPGAEYLKQKEAYELAIEALKFQSNIKEACCSLSGFELKNYIREEVKKNEQL